MRAEDEIRATIAEYHTAFNRTGQTNREWCADVGAVAVDLAEDVEDLLAEVADLRRRLNDETLRAERCLTQLMHAKQRQDLVVAALVVERAKVEAVEKACDTLDASGEYITPPELHHVEDQLVALCVAGIRTAIDRSAASPAPVQEQQQG